MAEWVMWLLLLMVVMKLHLRQKTVAILKEFSYVKGVASPHRIWRGSVLKSETCHAIKEYINIMLWSEHSVGLVCLCGICKMFGHIGSICKNAFH